MFKKMLAKLGKGAATVDLKLDNNEYVIGDYIRGEIVIRGGEVEQSINQLAVHFMMNVGLKQGSSTQQISVSPICSKDIIQPEEVKVIPFHFEIPTDIPFSSNSVSYYFDTHLDIAGGLDRKDMDDVQIKPNQPIQAIFKALNSLGFREKPTSGKIDAYGQEFAFFPTEVYAGQISEIELRLVNEATGIRVFLEVDIRTNFKEVEAKREFIIEYETLYNDEQTIKQLTQNIKELMEQPYMCSQPFSFEEDFHTKHRSSGLKNAIPGMVGGLAVGLIGSLLIDEMLEDLDVDDFVENLSDDFEDATEDFTDFFENDEI